MNETLRIRVQEISQAGEARRVSAEFCRAAGVPQSVLDRTALIVTEMATNLARHAGGGELLLRSLENGTPPAIEILSIDKGPGLLPSQCLEDGFSTVGGSGFGLGSIRRLSSQFDIFCRPEHGTVLLSRCWAGPVSPDVASPVEVGAVSLPLCDGEPCGDGWAANHRNTGSTILLCDGLGHGFQAAQAAGEAMRVFAQYRTEAPQPIVESLHAALRGTRGAALAVLEADLTGSVARFCGIGNIAGRLAREEKETYMVSHNGTAGHDAHKIQEFTYPWDGSGLLIMHSDGLSTRWRLAEYPGLGCRHPSVVAAVLYRDFSRGNDDVTILVMRSRNPDGRAETAHELTDQ